MATATHPVPQYPSLSPHSRPGSVYTVPPWQPPGGPTGGQWAAPGSPRSPNARPPGLPAAHPAAIIAQAPGSLCVELQLPLQLGHVL